MCGKYCRDSKCTTEYPVIYAECAKRYGWRRAIQNQTASPKPASVDFDSISFYSFFSARRNILLFIWLLKFKSNETFGP